MNKTKPKRQKPEDRAHKYAVGLYGPSADESWRRFDAVEIWMAGYRAGLKKGREKR